MKEIYIGSIITVMVGLLVIFIALEHKRSNMESFLQEYKHNIGVLHRVKEHNIKAEVTTRDAVIELINNKLIKYQKDCKGKFGWYFPPEILKLKQINYDEIEKIKPMKYKMTFWYSKNMYTLIY